MADQFHTVQRGDTLSSIAKHYNTTLEKLKQLNPDIKSVNYILVGERIKVSGTGPSIMGSVGVNKSNKAEIVRFGLISDTKRDLFATWKWDKENTKEYQVKWLFDTGNGQWFNSDESSGYSTTRLKQSRYSAPTNAKRVKFLVKPVAKTHTVNKKETSYWTANWSTEKIYTFKAEAPETPSAPTLTISGQSAKLEIDNLPNDITEVYFELYMDDNSRYKYSINPVANLYSSVTYNVATGHRYKARCKVKNKSGLWSEWSNYSGNEGTLPSASRGITEIRALTETSIYIAWSSIYDVDTYDIQYTTKPEYFDSSSEVSSTSVEKIVTHAEITGLEPGEEYFFRVRGVNSKGESSWTSIRSIVLGKKPSAPTSWSSTTTAIVGEPLTLYWNHNSEDGSAWTYSNLMIVVGTDVKYEVIPNLLSDDDKYKTISYEIDTSTMTEGTRITWMVQTAGITQEYGPWSVLRTIDVYAQPVLYTNIMDQNGNSDIIKMLPLKITNRAYPDTQRPTGFHISIAANEAHIAVDNFGNEISVGAGDVVFSKYYDYVNRELITKLSASELSLENNIEYTLTCTVSMNSGLTAESINTFKVGWDDYGYIPNAEVVINEEDYSAMINPYCDNGSGRLLENILMSVYRREFDGTFTAICEDVENKYGSYYIDPHVSLDYARYRIVAKSKLTGEVTYYDMPSIPVGVTSIIIQWDSKWVPYNVIDDGEQAEPALSTSMLILPYNIGVSEGNKQDVELVEYIGRKHPVSYYGTQVGSTQAWNTEIPKNDIETIHALRRLQVWMGDVYVREPSGNGYWANIKVSFNQKHLNVTIPVTLNVTRVEGGV